MNDKVTYIELNDEVEFRYFGYDENGTIFDQPEEPTICIIGDGFLLKKFEKNLLGMRKGEKKSFSIAPEDAYGPYEERLLVEIPIKKFPNIHPHIGMKITIPLEKITKNYPMEIVAVSDISVTLDANHPLAGKILYYDVEILNIKKK